MTTIATINADYVREQLVAKLEAAGMSHSELARRAGFDQTAVSNFIARRRNTLGLEYIEAAAAALGCTRADLTGEAPLADVRMIEARLLAPSLNNPRHAMDPEGLDELRQSIIERGILQNLTVRPGPSDETPWIVIAGHRRLKATMLAVEEGDLPENYSVPCRVRTGDETEALTEALIENLHREDMHPLDEAEAYEKLRNWLQCSAAEVGRRVGKEPRYVQQRLALVEKLAPVVIEAYRGGKLNFTQARAFCLGDADIQENVLATVLSSTWLSDPVSIERTVKREQEAKEHKAANPPPPPPSEEELAEAQRKREEEAAARADRVQAANDKATAEEKEAYLKSNQFNTLFRSTMKGDLELVARKALRDMIAPAAVHRALQSNCVGTLPEFARPFASSLFGIDPPAEEEEEAVAWIERARAAIDELEDGKAGTIILQLIIGTARPAQVRSTWAGYVEGSYHSTYGYRAEVETEASRELCVELKVTIPAELMPKPKDEDKTEHLTVAEVLEATGTDAEQSAEAGEGAQVELEDAIAAASVDDAEEAV